MSLTILPEINRPMDSRNTCETYEEMISESTWINSNNENISFVGLIAAVTANPDESKNGVYVLKALPASATNWERVGAVSAMRYKGSVETLEDLELVQYPEVGDIYLCTTDNKNYIWNGSNWDVFGQSVDLTDYATKVDLAEAVADEAELRIEGDAANEAALKEEAAARETRDNELEAMIKALKEADVVLQQNIDSNTTEITKLKEAIASTQDTIDKLETSTDTKFEETNAQLEELKSAIEEATKLGNKEHNDLGGREEEDCHPMEAIAGLEEAFDKVDETIKQAEGNIQEELDKKADKEDTYTKEEVDKLVEGGFDFKGGVDSPDNLPGDASAGDVYIDQSTNDAYIWNGDNWINLGPLMNLDHLATKEELTQTEKDLLAAIEELKQSIGEDLSGKIENIETDIEQLKDTIEDKANAADVYTKEETDDLLDEKQDTLTPGYGIEIDPVTGVIQTQKTVTVPDYSRAATATEMPYTATSDCTIVGSLYAIGGGYSVTVNDAVIITCQGWSNFTVNLKEGDVLAASSTLDEVHLSIMSYDIAAFPTDDFYTKTQIDKMISAVYKYKGSVADFKSLPLGGMEVGDVYNTEETGDNYAWTGTEWDKLAGIVNLDDYVTRDELNETYDNIEDTIREQANTVSALDVRVETLENLGSYVGAFDTFAKLPSNRSDLDSITVNDFATVRVDSNHSNAPTRYIVTTINEATGAIVWSYDFTYSTDITGKMNLVTGAVTDNIATYTANGQIQDSGKKLSEYLEKTSYTVVNNLTSTSTTNPLSAYQGKLLNTKVTSLENNPYTLPTASSTTLGGIKVGSNLSISNGVLSANAYVLPYATETTKGGFRYKLVEDSVNGNSLYFYAED